MIGSSTHLFWKEEWNDKAKDHIAAALQQCNTSFEEVLTAIEPPSDETALAGSAGQNWSSLLLPLHSLLGDDVPSVLSKIVNSPVLCVVEYDQEAWGYELTDHDEILDGFWNASDGYEGLGNAQVLSQVFGVSIDIISPYLKRIDAPNAVLGKAFTDDEYPLDDPWVRIDFLKKLGILYPENGTIYRVVEIESKKNAKEGSNSKKPWWRLW